MKKKLFRILTALLALVMSVSIFAGCNQNKPERGENKINIRAYEGGYGVAWLEKMVEKFNATFKEQGYEAILKTPDPMMTGSDAQQEMATNSDWCDIYYVGNMGLKSVVDGNFGTLVREISTGVMEKPAIGFDGKEESVTIKSKEVNVYDTDITEKDGKRYALHGAQSIGGMIVNKTKLDGYGLEIPRTTNEMIAAFDKILLTKTTSNENSYNEKSYKPMTYLSGTNGYPQHFFNAWLAQYEGADWWERFWAYKDADGNDMTTNGYELYNAKGIEYAMTTLYAIYDDAYCAPGSANNSIKLAHVSVMNPTSGTAVFMADGEWAYNEVDSSKAGYNKGGKIEDLAFANIPVISALGVKLFGAGTSYNMSEVDCDKVLSLLVDLADKNETVENAIAKVKTDLNKEINATEVIRVYEARGVYCDRAMGPGSWWICNKTENAEICELFFRMLASDDAAKEIARTANMVSCYSSDYSAFGDSGYWKSVKQIFNSEYSKGIWTSASGLRLEMNHVGTLQGLSATFYINMIQETCSAFTGSTPSNYRKGDTSIYATAAAEKIKTMKTAAKNAFTK